MAVRIIVLAFWFKCWLKSAELLKEDNGTISKVFQFELLKSARSTPVQVYVPIPGNFARLLPLNEIITS